MATPKSTLEVRFWRKVRKTDSCWLWIGAKRFNGYGVIAGHDTTKLVVAHRASWEMANGPIPAGLIVCHKCDTPACVRPDHLFVGTHADNTADMVSKGRHRKPASAYKPKERPRAYSYSLEYHREWKAAKRRALREAKRVERYRGIA